MDIVDRLRAAGGFIEGTDISAIEIADVIYRLRGAITTIERMEEWKASERAALAEIERLKQSVEYWKHQARERNEKYLQALADLGATKEQLTPQPTDRYANAIPLVEACIANGDGPGLMQLAASFGLMFADPRGVKHDGAEVLAWLRKKAEQASPKQANEE